MFNYVKLFCCTKWNVCHLNILIFFFRLIRSNELLKICIFIPSHHIQLYIHICIMFQRFVRNTYHLWCHARWRDNIAFKTVLSWYILKGKKVKHISLFHFQPRATKLKYRNSNIYQNFTCFWRSSDIPCTKKKVKWR